MSKKKETLIIWCDSLAPAGNIDCDWRQAGQTHLPVRRYEMLEQNCREEFSIRTTSILDSILIEPITWEKLTEQVWRSNSEIAHFTLAHSNTMTEAKTCLLTTCTLLPQTAKAFQALRAHGRLLFFLNIKREKNFKKKKNTQKQN